MQRRLRRAGVRQLTGHSSAPTDTARISPHTEVKSSMMLLQGGESQAAAQRKGGPGKFLVIFQSRADHCARVRVRLSGSGDCVALRMSGRGGVAEGAGGSYSWPVASRGRMPNRPACIRAAGARGSHQTRIAVAVVPAALVVLSDDVLGLRVQLDQVLLRRQLGAPQMRFDGLALFSGAGAVQCSRTKDVVSRVQYCSGVVGLAGVSVLPVPRRALRNCGLGGIGSVAAQTGAW